MAGCEQVCALADMRWRSMRLRLSLTGEVLVAAVELHHFVLVSLLPILLQLADCLGLLIVKQGRAK